MAVVNIDPKATLKALLLSAALGVTLTACGGGGGGSSTPPVVVTPPTPPSSNVADEFPDNFSVELEEGDAFRSVRSPVFQITAPSTTDDVTASVTQTGDGRFFAVAVIASDPNSAGIRDIQLEFTSTADLDFEMPADANADNVYDFVISGAYQSESLSANVSLTITDKAEPVSLTPRIIEGFSPGQQLGSQIVTLDLGGDPTPEIALPFGNDNAAGSGVILDDVFLTNGNTGLETLGNSTEYGTLFLNDTDTRVGQSNRITEQGRKLLISEEIKNRLTLFDISNDADRAALRGDLDLTTAQSNRAVYNFDEGDNPIGRIIRDVNGDGQEDIFVLKNTDAAFSDRELGIIYGSDVITPENSDRTGDFDLTLTYSSSLDGFIIDVIPYVVDLDGDNLEELVIVSPGYTNGDGRAVGRIWVLNSAVLRDGTTTSIDLDALSSAQGASLSGSGNPQYDTVGQEDLGIGNSFVIIQDLDGDGSPRILFTDRNRALYSIDGDELLSFESASMDDFFTAGGYRLSSFLGFNFFAGTVSSGFDLNGDFTTDIMITNDGRRMAQIASGEDIAQTVQRAAETSGLIETPIGETPLVTLDFSALANPVLTGSAPVYSGIGGSVGQFLFADSGANENRGRLIIVEESDILRETDAALTDTPTDTIILTLPTP